MLPVTKSSEDDMYLEHLLQIPQKIKYVLCVNLK